MGQRITNEDKYLTFGEKDKVVMCELPMLGLLASAYAG